MSWENHWLPCTKCIHQFRYFMPQYIHQIHCGSFQYKCIYAWAVNNGFCCMHWSRKYLNWCTPFGHVSQWNMSSDVCHCHTLPILLLVWQRLQNIICESSRVQFCFYGICGAPPLNPSLGMTTTTTTTRFLMAQLLCWMISVAPRGLQYVEVISKVHRNLLVTSEKSILWLMRIPCWGIIELINFHQGD